MKIEKETLFLFNLSMDLNNPILANTILWANQFADQFKSVQIYTTHSGRYSASSNVKVLELGGGSFGARLGALLTLTRAIPMILKSRKTSVVFHHQSPRTSVFPGIVFRLAGIKQGIWYSHSSKPISLKIGSKIVEEIYSSSQQSFPLNSTKTHFLGHGIDTELATQAFIESYGERSRVLFVGRITPIKRLELCINAIAESGISNLDFVAVGPIDTRSKYLDNLITLAFDRKVSFTHMNSIDHDQVFALMATSSMFFAGMQNSVDKSCLEAAATGSFVVTTDLASAELSGMKHFWKLISGSDALPSLSNQIKLISLLDSKLAEKMRIEIQSISSELNSASELIRLISNSMKEV